MRLTGNVTLKQTTFDVVWPETRYDFEASVRSIGGSATISVYSTGDNTNPLMQATSNSSGEWTTLQMSCLTGSSLTGEDHFVITIEGSNVDVDDLSLTAVAFVGNVTKPVIVKQKVRDKATGQMVTAAEWDYHEDDYTVLEKKYVNTSDYMASKYEYQDGTFTVLKKRIDCKILNDDPDNPTGTTYTTIYDPNENTDLYATDQRHSFLPLTTIRITGPG